MFSSCCTSIISLFLIGVVLLQTGKSADLAGAFGGQGSQTAFGPRGAANLLTKLTTYAAILFMLTSVGLTVVLSRTGGAITRSCQAPRLPPRSKSSYAACPNPKRRLWSAFSHDVRDQ